jgi:hypothetical protein
VAIVAFTLIGATLILDYLIFNKLLFSIPNEMEWDTSHWYNFAYASREAKQPVDGKKVIITGSSVALYSVLPDQMFPSENKKIHPQFYSHVALAPTDLYYYKEDIAKANPDLVVYLLNFADLQWEYISIKNGEFVFDEARWLNEYSDRYPARTNYPTEFLSDYFSKLNKKQIAKLAAKSLLYVNRYRHFAFDSVETWFDNHLRSGRSFQKYNGSIPKEGVWSKGWTGPQATLHCNFNRTFDDSIFTLKKNTVIKVTVYSASKPDISHNKESIIPVASTVLNFDKSGWNAFSWDRVSGLAGVSSAEVKLEVLEGMGTATEANLYKYGKDFPVGVRLSHYFCKTPAFTNKSYSRDSYIDEKRFTEMNSIQYDEDYFLRILDHAGERPELGRLHTLYNKKREIKDLTFKPWFEYNQILRVSRYFKEKNIPFVIVMSPENPLESSAYVDGKWFNGMLTHLKESLRQNQQKLINHTLIIGKKQSFFDPHHLTYDGAESFNPFIETLILDELQGANQ